MKRFLFVALVIGIIAVVSSCKKQEGKSIVIKGRLIRELTGEPVANKGIYVSIFQWQGSGIFSTRKEIDSKVITTDVNGYFVSKMRTVENAIAFVSKMRDEYTDLQIETNQLTDSIILKTSKYLNFEVGVKNTNPVDGNDKIYINFFSGLEQNFQTKIENFGIPNLYIPEENGAGPIDYPQWTGMNVNSIVHFIVPENAETFKVYWEMTKGGVESKGVTNEIPFDRTNSVHRYDFEY